MNIRGTTLLIMALVFSLVGSAVNQDFGTPGIIGLFYGILPKKEFRILFMVGIVVLGWGLVNMQTFLYSTYMAVNFNDLNTAIDYTHDSTDASVVEGFSFNGIISGLIDLPQIFKNALPTQVNIIGEFLGAGILSLILTLGLIGSLIALIYSIFAGLVYISNYLILRNLLFKYMPSTPIFVPGNYPTEFSTIMASSACTIYIVYFFGTMALTYLIFKRIGLYRRIPTTLWGGKE